MSANAICPNCGGLWARLYESDHGLVCRACYRNPEAREYPYALARVRSNSPNA